MTSRKNIDARFDEIIEDALGEAAGVKCSAAVYRENLRGWISTIQTAISASEETDDANLSDDEG